MDQQELWIQTKECHADLSIANGTSARIPHMWIEEGTYSVLGDVLMSFKL